MAESSPKTEENTKGKGKIARYVKRLVLQTRENKGLFGKGLIEIKLLKSECYCEYNNLLLYYSKYQSKLPIIKNEYYCTAFRELLCPLFPFKNYHL